MLGEWILKGIAFVVLGLLNLLGWKRAGDWLHKHGGRSRQRRKAGGLRDHAKAPLKAKLAICADLRRKGFAFDPADIYLGRFAITR